MRSQQSEAGVAAIIKIDPASQDILDRRIRFALARLRNHDCLGQPRGDIDLSIQASPIACRSVVIRVGHRPCHVGHGRQERAVDGHGLLQQFVQIVLRRRGRPLLFLHDMRPF